MDKTVVSYEENEVEVPQEVADFLEADRKRAQAEARSDRRHLCALEFSEMRYAVTSMRAVEDAVIRKMEQESLREAVSQLEPRERRLLSSRFDDELTLEEIGKQINVSKTAVSKQLKKLYEQLRSAVE